MRERLHFLLLNVGHFLDHLFTLIFATVAALALHREWGLGYADLLKYATPGFFAFGVFALPAGWLADKWSREGMMGVFFVGIGLASIATAFARTPFEIGLGLFVVGVFAAIYHPVGLAIVVEKWKNTGMRIAVNGVWGNLGVASAALITGYFIDHGGWRIGVRRARRRLDPDRHRLHVLHVAGDRRSRRPRGASQGGRRQRLPADFKALLLRVSAIVFLTTAVSSIIFQSTTFALPKVFDERLGGIARIGHRHRAGWPSSCSRWPRWASSSSAVCSTSSGRAPCSSPRQRSRSCFSRSCRACRTGRRWSAPWPSCWRRSARSRSTTT